MKFNFAYTRLFSSDYDACLQFYRDVIGLEVTYSSPLDRYAELSTGKTKLTIMCRGQIKSFFGSQTSVFFGNKDDAIALSLDVNDIEDACDYLIKKGVEIVSKPWSFKNWGVKLALIRDPEGNLVELIQESQMVGAE